MAHRNLFVRMIGLAALIMVVFTGLASPMPASAQQEFCYPADSGLYEECFSSPQVQPVNGPVSSAPATQQGGSSSTDTGAIGCGSRYRVQSGDTMSGIAASYGISLSSLTGANPGVQPSFITVGQCLNIPSGGATAAPPAAVAAPAAPPRTTQSGGSCSPEVTVQCDSPAPRDRTCHMTVTLDGDSITDKVMKPQIEFRPGFCPGSLEMCRRSAPKDYGVRLHYVDIDIVLDWTVWDDYLDQRPKIKLSSATARCR